MSCPDCRKYENCSAPLCPRDPESESSAWFPDEDVCVLKDVPAWAKRQRRISKLGLPWTAGYFTVEMLGHPCRISKGLKGLDPDKDPKTRPEDVESWKAARPGTSDKTRAEMSRRGFPKKAELLGLKGSEEGSSAARRGFREKKGTQLLLSS